MSSPSQKLDTAPIGNTTDHKIAARATAHYYSETEITLKEAMQNLLDNEKLADIYLKGTDGVLVHAQRSVLAGRSKVFECLLFGPFAEASSKQVELGYKGRVLRAVAEYIYTDNAALLSRDFENCRETIRDLVALISAASYFALPELCRKTERLAVSMMDKDPSLAIEFLMACQWVGHIGCEDCSSVERHAIGFLGANPETLLEGSAVSILSASQMEKLLTDEHITVINQYTCFLILQKWAEGNASITESSGMEPPSSPTTSVADHDTGKRMNLASLMTRLIRLEEINPNHLTASVAASGLVTKDQLCDAYMAQALLGMRKHRLTYEPPVWKKSNKAYIESKTDNFTTELLKGDEILATGKLHKWKIRIEKLCNLTWLGVAVKSKRLDYDEFLGNQALGYAYGSNGTIGYAAHDNQWTSFPVFGEGTIIAIALDLTGDGTLSVSIDGGISFFELYTNMIARLPRDSEGFVPAASLRRPGKVRFLGFE